MSVRRSLLFVAAGVMSLALLAGVGLFYSVNRTQKAPVAASKPELSATAKMRAVLVPPDQQPEGTQVQEMDVKDAAAAHMFGVPAGFTFAPTTCVEYLGAAIGDPGTYAGWVQFGVSPKDAKGDAGQFSSMALAAPGGVDLGKIESSANACAKGRMSMTKLKVGATVKLAKHEALSLPGAQTLGLTITTDFDPGTTAAQRAAVIGTCQAPSEPQQNIEFVSYACAEAAKKETAKATTSVRYAAYMSYNGVLYEACAVSAAEADQMLTTAYERARDVMGG